MLKGLKGLKTQIIFISAVTLILIGFLGYFQFSSLKTNLKTSPSEKAGHSISSIIEQLVEFENSVINESGPIDKVSFYEKKEEIQQQLKELESYNLENELEHQQFIKLLQIVHLYFFYVDQLLGQSQSAIGTAGQLSFDHVPLLYHLNLFNQVNDTKTKNTITLVHGAYDKYLYLILILLIISVMVAVIFNHKINTEYKTCEDAIVLNQTSKEVFEQAEQIAGLGHGFYNFKSKKTRFSDNLYRIFGFEPKSFPSSLKGYLQNVVLSDRKKVFTALKSARIKQEAQNIRIKIKTKEDTVRILQLRILLKDVSSGRVLIFVNRDLTSELENRKKLDMLSSRLNFQNMLLSHAESIGEMGYYFYDYKTEVVGFSDQLFHLLGYKAQAFEGSIEKFLEFVHPEERLSTRQAFDPEAPELPFVINPIRLVSSDEDLKYIRLSKDVVQDGTNKIMLIAIKDVSLEILNNFKLSAQNRELMKKNEELESFNYVTSHDLQEPLRKIQLFISIIKEMKELKFTPKGYDYFKRIQNSANRMQLLINDLLEYANISRGENKFITSDLNELLKGALEELAHLIDGKNAIIEAKNLPFASVIPFQFHQLFLNIVGNALKYAKPEQRPMVEIQTEKLTRQELQLFPQYAASDLIKITIRDNGLGFEQRYASYIFQPFKRYDNGKGVFGSGIGLAICKKIIENHNGQIFASGAPQKGATFSFIIPKHQ